MNNRLNNLRVAIIGIAGVTVCVIFVVLAYMLGSMKNDNNDKDNKFDKDDKYVEAQDDTETEKSTTKELEEGTTKETEESTTKKIEEDTTKETEESTSKEIEIDKQRVYDYPDFLNVLEEAKLQKLCDEVSESTKLDVVTVLTDDLGGKEARDYADDFYDNNRFGYEFEYGSGVLFLISEDGNGEVYISTAGLGILFIDDLDIERILDAGWDDFAYNYKYYDCLVKMIDKMENIVLNFEHLDGKEDVMKKWYSGEYSDYIEFYEDYCD